MNETYRPCWPRGLSCVTLSELFNFSELQTSHLEKGANHGAFLTELLRGVDEGT